MSLFQIPSLNNTFGAAFIGMIAASVLYGITTLQTYLYYSLYPNDRKGLKILVGLLWIVDTLSLILICHGIYVYLVTDFANPLALLEEIWSIEADPALGGLVALATHAFLGMRVWTVGGKSIWLAIVLIVPSLLAFAISIVAVVVAFRFKLWTNTSELKWLAIVGDGSTMVADIIIAVILCIYLQKSKSNVARTNKIIHGIVIFSVNTGLASSILSILNLITYLALPNTLIFLAFNFIVTKVYANALLANLNARETLRGRGIENESGILSLNVSAFRGNPLHVVNFEHKAIASPAIDVSIDSATMHFNELSSKV